MIDNALALSHLRLSSDYPMDQVAPYLAGARAHAEGYMGRKIYDSTEELTAAVLAGTAGGDPIIMDDQIQAGVLLMLGFFYRTREDPGSTLNDPRFPTVAYQLLHPYRVDLGV